MKAKIKCIVNRAKKEDASFEKRESTKENGGLIDLSCVLQTKTKLLKNIFF